MRSSSRPIRYGAPIVTVIVGVLFAAFQTNSLGNTVSLVLIAGGLIWLMTTLGRDMGMTANTGHPPRIPELPPQEAASGAESDRSRGAPPPPEGASPPPEVASTQGSDPPPAQDARSSSRSRAR